MITEAWIIEAWLFLRKNNFTIPDEVLDFMKDASIQKLKEKEKSDGDKGITDNKRG